MLSRVKTYDNLYFIGEFKKSAIKVNKDALLEYKGPKKNDLFSTMKRNAILGDTVASFVNNMRSFPRHVDDIVKDNLIINNDFIGFAETQMKPSDSTCKITEMLKVNIFLSLAYGCRNDVTVLNKFD